MPVKGTYLALAAGGGVLIWSGLRGKSWSQVLRNVISGKTPEATTTAYQIAPASYPDASGVGANLGVGSQGIVGPSSAGEKAWDSALCLSLLAPPTPANLRSLSAWRTHECPWNNQPPDGALYTNNPFNTTWPGFGGTSINSVGVKKYPNVGAGIAATVATLNSGYPNIVAALRSGRGLCTGIGPSTLANDFFKWSNGGYSAVC